MGSSPVIRSCSIKECETQVEGTGEIAIKEVDETAGVSDDKIQVTGEVNDQIRDTRKVSCTVEIEDIVRSQPRPGSIGQPGSA